MKKILSAPSVSLLLCLAVILMLFSGCSLPEGGIGGKDDAGRSVTYGMKQKDVEKTLGAGKKLLGTIYQYSSGWSVGYRDGKAVAIYLRGTYGMQAVLPRTCYANKPLGRLTQKITVGKTTADDLADILGEPSGGRDSTRVDYLFVKSGAGGYTITDDISGIDLEDAKDMVALSAILSGDGTIYEIQVMDLCFYRTAK